MEGLDVKKVVIFLLMLLSADYCWAMQADSATEQSSPWYTKWLPWSKKQQKSDPEKTQQPTETKDALQPQSQTPEVPVAPKPDDHKAPKNPDGKDAKRAEPLVHGFPHPWAGLITVPKQDPTETEELDHKLCESVLEAFHEPKENKHYLLIKQLVIDGANPVIIWRDLKNQFKEEETWRYIVYAMNIGLIESRVKPFGSCGKADCYLPEYLLLLTAPAGATLPLEKTKVIEMLPDLLAFCNDPRMHYINAGGPLTLLLSDCIFFETDPTLVLHYKKLRHTLNTPRFNRKIFLRDIYQIVLSDVQMAGNDKTAFCKKEGIDQRILRLEEAADGSVYLPVTYQAPTVFVKQQIQKRTKGRSCNKNSPWHKFKNKPGQDVPVSKKYDEQLKELVQAVASLSKATDKYTKIGDVIARGGDPECVQVLIKTIIRTSKKLDNISLPAAIRGIEYAVNTGLLQARRYPFGDCGKDDCYLAHYLAMVFAPSGVITVVGRDDAWNAIPALLEACPDHEKHCINGKTVVAKIKEIIKTPARLKKNIAPVQNMLRKNFPDLEF